MWVEEAWTSSLDDFIRIRPEWANASATIQTERKKEVCFIHQCLFLFIYVAKIYLILKFKFQWKSILAQYFLPTYKREVIKLLNPRGMSNLMTDDNNSFGVKKELLFKPITEENFKEWRAGPGIDVNKVYNFFLFQIIKCMIVANLLFEIVV